MNPPLRTRADIDALIGGIADGTITILASDHAPHTRVGEGSGVRPRAVRHPRAGDGVRVVPSHSRREQKAIGLPRLIELLTINPARLLKLKEAAGRSRPARWRTSRSSTPAWNGRSTPEESASRSRNTPFGGWRLKGRAVRTMVGGRTVWKL